MNVAEVIDDLMRQPDRMKVCVRLPSGGTVEVKEAVESEVEIEQEDGTTKKQTVMELLVI